MLPALHPLVLLFVSLHHLLGLLLVPLLHLLFLGFVGLLLGDALMIAVLQLLQFLAFLRLLVVQLLLLLLILLIQLGVSGVGRSGTLRRRNVVRMSDRVGPILVVRRLGDLTLCGRPLLLLNLWSFRLRSRWTFLLRWTRPLLLLNLWSFRLRYRWPFLLRWTRPFLLLNLRSFLLRGKWPFLLRSNFRTWNRASIVGLALALARSRGWAMNRACLSGGDDSVALKCSRAGRRCDGWAAVVGGGAHFRIGARRFHVLGLR